MRFDLWKYKVKLFFNYIFHFKKYSGLSFYEAMNLTGVPAITVQVISKGERRQLNFIVDTGADLCRVDKSAIEGLEFERVGSCGSTYAAGSVINEELPMVEIPFIYRDNLRISGVFVVQDLSESFNAIKESDGVTVHGVIGSSLLSKYSWILDYSIYRIY